VLTGVVPGFRSARIDVNSTLRSGMGGRVTQRGWRYLVAAELAMAVILLCNAGLMVRTMLALDQLNLGFDPSNVATTELRLPLNRIMTGHGRPEWDRLAAFYQNVVETADATPGIQGAALMAAPSIAGPQATWLARSGIVSAEPDESPAWHPIQHRAVSGDYFAVLRLPIRRGRGFSSEDRNGAFLTAGGPRPTGVAIVSEAAARSLWPGEDPIGKSLTIGGDSRASGRIVIGVVGDARDLAPDREPQPTIYVPFGRSPDLGVTLLVRGSGSNSPALISAVRGRLRAMDPLMMIGPIGPFAARYAAAIAPRRYLASVLAIFACFGLALAGVGLYGLTAASVNQRLPEFAVRLALGATPEGVRGTVLREVSLIVGLGLIVGAVGAWAGTRLLQTQLFGVGGLDPQTWIVTVLVLAASALVAAWIPARRAARSDPGSMLRMS
jgi:predicted permease